MRNILILLLAALSLSSCNDKGNSKAGNKNHQTNRYEKDNFVFDIPEGWKITDEDVSDSLVTVNCEKVGVDESGQFTFAFIGIDADLDHVLELSMETLNKKVARFGTKVIWHDHVDDVTLNEFKVKSRKFTFTNSGFTFSGANMVFSGCGRTVLMSYVEAEEDHDKNAPGYKVVTESIACK